MLVVNFSFAEVIFQEARVATKSFRMTLLRQIFSIAILVAGAGSFTGSAYASEYVPDLLSPSLIDEFRLGVQSHDLSRDENGVNLNAEVLFRRPNIYYGNRVLTFFLNPRFHIGGSLNTAGDTSKAYAGATWDYRLTNNMFVEASFGGVIHDGDLNRASGANTPALGCRVMFRESASAGIELTESMRVMVTIDHISNASLCKFNDGLTTLGARIGFKF